MVRKTTKNSKKNEKEGKLDLEVLSTDEIKELSKRGTADLAAINEMVSYVQQNLVNGTNGSGSPLFVSLEQLHAKFNVKTGFSKAKNLHFLNGRVNRVLHKDTVPAIWCKYLIRDGTTFVYFFEKQAK